MAEPTIPMADIFISYSKSSKAQTEQLAQELRGKGFTVWYDTSLVPGDSFRDVITSELAQARAAIVIWTSDSVKSNWVCAEASRAHARGILIPVRVDNVRSHDIPLPFNSLHTESLSNRSAIEAALAKLGVTPMLATEGGPPASPALADRVVRPALALPDKPSIAVLPFRNMSGDPEQEYFADGIAEDIITMLSRSPWLFVTARNSTFTYKSREVDVKQVGRELGVRYVLGGSVRRGGNRVRISTQLTDAETGNHLWADRYDRDPTDIFSVQDEITEAVAIAVVPAVEQMEQHRSVRKPPDSLGAWEAFQRGRWHFFHYRPIEHEAAKKFFRRAIDLDPNFAQAHAALSFTLLNSATRYQQTSLAEVSDEVLALAQRAVSLDPSDVFGHNSLGWALWMRGDLEGALAEARKGVTISPNHAGIRFLLGVTLLFSGQPREGFEALRNSIRLDPLGPQHHDLLGYIAVAHYVMGEYDAAVEAANAAIRSNPDHRTAYRYLAAAHGQVGRSEEARQALQKAIAVAPKSFDMYVRQRAPWFRVEDYEHMLEGLRKAGWEG
jgi:adenylate cyclase